jgi:bifunctional UDP-N-acetylglucosamine pyrophosphorylase / glucosamine-1-phosphate N-acetyltransferase
MSRLLIIPAAGRGSRLGGSTPKPLVRVNGRPMLDHLSALYRGVVDDVVVVSHPSFEAEISEWGRPQGNVSVAVQAEATGMLDAILLAGPMVREKDPREIWITWSDQVGVLPGTVRRLADVASATPRPAMALPTVPRRHPYIHFERDAAGRISRLLQRREGDAMPDAGESDMGLFAMTRETFELDLQDYARDVPPGSATGERNFLPFIPWLAQRRTVATFPCTDPMEAIGINTPDELAQVEAWLRTR